MKLIKLMNEKSSLQPKLERIRMVGEANRFLLFRLVLAFLIQNSKNKDLSLVACAQAGVFKSTLLLGSPFGQLDKPNKGRILYCKNKRHNKRTGNKLALL